MIYKRECIIRFFCFFIFTISICSASDKNNESGTSVLNPKLEEENNSIELFELLFSEAKSSYVEALIAAHFNDTLDIRYNFERTFEVVSEISELDTLTALQRDDFSRFCEKISDDFQRYFSYLNGDTSLYSASIIREEISETLLDTIEIGGDKLVIIDDRPGHLPIVTSRRIEGIIDFFVNREHERFQKWLDNSGLYREHMMPVLREYGLPDEIFYLALIESGYNPLAYSYAHAVGPWQFIAGTGSRYGLKRNWWIDERRDPIKSTHAAAKYLRSLYDKFDDWFLAMAAYNCGELRVWRAIRREGTRDYWKLRTLPRQSRNYIPTLMAGIIIALNPEKYGFTDSPKETWRWDEVVLKKSYELEGISRVLGISTKSLREYNPELRRWVTPPDIKSYTLRVPKGKSKILIKKLSKIPVANSEPKWVSHRVRRGQTLSYIARRYKTSVSAIVAANNIRNRNQIRAGQKLLIPTNGHYFPSKNIPQAGKRIVHVVRKGETLSEIAEAYHVSLRKVRSWNNLYGKRFIYPGQKIYIYRSKSG